MISNSNFPEASMLQRHPAIVLAVIGLLPVVLAACSDAASSLSDPRTRPPLVRIEAVERPGAAGRAVPRHFRAPAPDRLGVPGSRENPGHLGEGRPNLQAR